MNNKFVGFIVGSAAFLSMFVASNVVLAEGNSEPGLNRYLENLGRQQATEVGAQCDSGAGSGAFGYLGVDMSMAGGADGVQTGINNSAVCGNR
jgi:hypothetical protein